MLVTGLLAVASGAFASWRSPARAAACGNAGQVTTSGSWTTIHPPLFPDSSAVQTVTAYAVDPGTADHLLVTNGTTVMRSDDGGCNWRATFTAPTTSLAVITAQPGQQAPVQLVVTRLALANGPIGYLELEAQSAQGNQGSHYSEVRHTSDGGDTWSVSAGLPQNTGVTALAVSIARPNMAYVSVQGGSLYATTNSGQTWSSQGSFGGDVNGMKVDDGGENLFGWRGGVVYRSRDGGAPGPVAQFSSGVTTADVSDPTGHGLVVTLFLGDQTVAQSKDGGTTWLPLWSTNQQATSVVHGWHVPGRLLAVTPNSVVTATGDQQWTDVTPNGSTVFQDAESTETDVAFVRTDDGLLRTGISTVVPSPAALRVPPGFLGPPGQPSLTPSGGMVAVAPGSTVTVNYALTVPHRYPAIDIYFLVDTTGSISETVEAVQRSLRSILTGLSLAHVNVRLGLGEFRDYPLLGYGKNTDVPYTRDRDLGLPDNQLIAAVSALQSGGGGDNPEAQLPALYQAATGAGQGAPGTPTYIAPGQQANFRDGVERVIMLATDAPFHRSDSDPTYPGPSFTATATALKQRGIKVVGLSLGSDSLHDLRAIALATGAVATADVDCNGEGHLDVAAGTPLVCPVDPDGTHLAAGVLDALGAVLPGAVAVPAVSGPGGVVRSVSPATFGTISLGIDHVLSFSVTYGCNPDQQGRRFPVNLTGLLDGAALTAATATVACSATAAPAPVRPAALVAAGPQPQPPAARSPSPPPQGSPSPPPPAPEVQLSPQANAQLQMAAGHQEQERVQWQIATVGSQRAPQPDVELAFSARRDRTLPSPYPLEGVMGLGALAGVWVIRSRRRTETPGAYARARITRRHA